MDIKNAQREFKKRLEGAGRGLEGLRVTEGIDAMLAFYRDTRVRNCELDADGDMLLFQWGTYEGRGATADDEGEEGPGGEERFTVNITRQLIPADAEDEIWQLGLTFEFEPEFEDLGDGNDWCHSPSELADFQADLNDSEVIAGVRELEPLAVRLTFENVE